MTKVVHCKREPFDVYIGRPSIYGNQFSHKPGTLAKFQVATREEAITKHREQVLADPEFVAMVRRELKDKVLGCWCKPLACHGDTYVDICDGEKPKEERP